MNGLSALAPAIVAAVLSIGGLVGYFLFTHNKPTLVRRPEPASEEEPPLPFDEPAPSEETLEVRPNFGRQFERHL